MATKEFRQNDEAKDDSGNEEVDVENPAEEEEVGRDNAESESLIITELQKRADCADQSVLFFFGSC